MNDKGELWLATPALRDSVSAFIDNSVILRRIILNIRTPLALFILVTNRSLSGGIKIDPIKGEIIDYMYGKSDKTDFITGITEY